MSKDIPNPIIPDEPLRHAVAVPSAPKPIDPKQARIEAEARAVFNGDYTG